MTTITSRKIWFSVVLVLLLFGISSIVIAQDDTPDCPSELDGEPVGCAHVYLPQETLLGDFYLDGELIFTQYPGYSLTTSVGSHQVDVRNIQSTEEGFGELFTYEDTSKTVWISQGQTREVTVYPKKTFIRGTLEFTCDIRDVTEGDSVACQVAIDDIPQEGTVPAGEQANYTLAPGEHKVTATLIGDLAHLWAPASDEATTTVRVGSTARVSSRFQKRAHLTLTLDQEGVLADLYVNDELVAAQVAATDLWLEPNKNYMVEARNITDPAAGSIYTWQTSPKYIYLGAGQTNSIEFNLQKKFLKGFLSVECQINGLMPGDDVYCQPSIDGVNVAPIPPGAIGEYILDPGDHTVEVILSPADKWYSEALSKSFNTIAGHATEYKTSFELYPPGFFSRPSDDYEECKSQPGTALCLRYYDDYFWYVLTPYGSYGSSVSHYELYRGYIVDFHLLCSGQRYAHILGTDLVNPSYAGGGIPINKEDIDNLLAQ